MLLHTLTPKKSHTILKDTFPNLFKTFAKSQNTSGFIFFFYRQFGQCRNARKQFSLNITIQRLQHPIELMEESEIQLKKSSCHRLMSFNEVYFSSNHRSIFNPTTIYCTRSIRDDCEILYYIVSVWNSMYIFCVVLEVDDGTGE